METCQYHNDLMQKIGSVEAGINNLISRADKINGRYEKHLEESVERCAAIERHEQILKDICSLRRWWWGAILAIIMSLVSACISAGVNIEKIKQLERRIDVIEAAEISRQTITTTRR